MIRRIVWSCVTLAVFLPSIASAQTSANARPLTRLVAADVGLCVEVRQFAKTWPAVAGSEFFKRIERLSFYRKWKAGNEYRKLLQTRSEIEAVIGKPLIRLTDELFGDDVVVAVYVDDRGRSQGVLLTRTAGVSVLEAAIAAWDRAEHPTTIARGESGGRYFRRVVRREQGRDDTLYYAKLGRTLAVSDQEAMIRRVLDLNRLSRPAQGSNGSPGKSLFDSAVYQRASGSLPKKTVASIYFNPRPWDGLFSSGSSPSGAKSVLISLWRRCRSVMVGLRVDRGVVFDAVVDYDGSGVPEAWTRFVRQAAGSPAFFQKVPRRALLAFGGRFSPSGLRELINRQMSDSPRNRWDSLRQVSRGLLLGLDLVDDVLPGLGPNWGFYMVPRQQDIRSAPGSRLPPVNGLLAIDLAAKKSASPGRPTLRAGLENGLNTGLNMLAALYNSQSSGPPAIVRTRRGRTGVVHWIEGIDGYQPAYALTATHLIFAGSPKLVDEFAATDSRSALTSSGNYQRLSQQYFTGAGQVLLVRVDAIRDLVRQHAAFFVRRAAKSPSQRVRNRFNNVREILTLFDSAFIAAGVTNDRVRLVIGGVVQDDR